MAKKRRKVRAGRRQDGKDRKSTNVDLISKLPDHVIHHILSYIPTIDAVRTSLLSRRWRRMWYSVSSLEFHEDIERSESFYNFVEQYLKLRKRNMHDDNTNSVITKFKLTLDSWRKSQVDRWLGFVAHSHLQELDLNVGFNDFEPTDYCLPQVVLNLASLTILNLENVELEACYPISLPSLKSLFLREVRVEDEELHNFLSSCPSLEKLCIRICEECALKNLRVLNLSLKLLDIFGGLKTIQVEAINLEYFKYLGGGTCHFDLASCKKINRISLSCASFHPDEDIASLISGFPLLESLKLYDCDLFDIRNQHLKFLDISYCRYKHEISIDAPNLLSFRVGTKDALERFSMNSPNLLETNICLGSCEDTYSTDWYINVIDFLSYFNCSKSISFVIQSAKVLMFPEILRKVCRCPLPNVKHLKVERWPWGKFQRKSDFRDALLWLSPSADIIHKERKKEKYEA